MKRLLQCLLLTLVFTGMYSPNLHAQCEIPAPEYLDITDITTNSATFEWAPVSGAVLYRVRLHDDFGNFYLPDAFTTQTTYTYGGLQPDHDYTVEVSASEDFPPNACFGDHISGSFTTEVIIVDVIAQLNIDCSFEDPGTQPNPFQVFLTPADPQEETVDVVRMEVCHFEGSEKMHIVQFVLWANCQNQVEFYQVSLPSDVVRTPQGPGTTETLDFNIVPRNGPAYDYLTINTPHFSGSTSVLINFQIANGRIRLCNDIGVNGDCDQGGSIRKKNEDQLQAVYQNTELEERTGAAKQGGLKIAGATWAELHVLPNPVSAVFQAQYSLSQSGAVSLELYDLSGRQVKTILDGTVLDAGNHITAIRANDLPPGMYTLVLQTAQSRQSTIVVKQ